MMLFRKENLFIILLFIAGISSCEKEEDNPNNPVYIQGEGAVITKTLTVSDFNQLELGVIGNVIISQGTTQEIKAIGNPNIIDKIEKTVSNNKWIIDFEDCCYENYKLTIEIVLPDILSITNNSSEDIIVNDFKNQNSLEMKLYGSGDITLNEFEGATQINSKIYGSGIIYAKRDVFSLESSDVEIAGSGDYKGFALIHDNNSSLIKGSGKVELTVNNSLEAEITGSGNILYKGMPTINKSITGSGDVIDVN